MKRLSRFSSIILLIAMVLSGTASVAQKARTISISGDNRVETAIEVSKYARGYVSEVDTVFLAGYNGDADALTATSIVGKMNGQLLISNKTTISTKLLSQIKKINPKEIIILGGENAVSPKIEKELIANKYTTRRIKGNSRIETAVKIAEDHYKDINVPEVFVVEYNSLVDALAIGPVAAKTGIPVLITQKDSVPDELIDFFENKGVEKVTIIGGESTVSKTGMKELEEHVDLVERVYGNDRIETSLNIAKKYFKNPKFAFIANGWKNADALIGGYFAGIKDAPILLTKQNNPKDNILNYIAKGFEEVYLLGGDAVLNANVYRLVDWSVRGQIGKRPYLLPTKPHLNYNHIPEVLPEGAILIEKRASERLHKYSYSKKLPNGGYIKEAAMTYFTDPGGEPMGYFSVTDNRGANFLAKIWPDGRLQYSFFTHYPIFEANDNNFLRYEMEKFFEVYGYF